MDEVKTYKDFILSRDYKVDPDIYKSKNNNRNEESSFGDQIIEFMSDGYFRDDNGHIMGYDGLKYVRVSNREMLTLIVDTLKKNKFPPVYWMHSAKSILNYILNTAYIPKFEPSRNYVCFNNGIYDLDRGKMIEANEKIESYIYFDHIYNPKQPGGLFKKFLNEILPDKDVQKVLQEALGCMFIDRSKIKIEKAFYLYGEGANGKSVIRDLLEYAIGTHNMSSYSLKELCDHREELYNRAEIVGKLINFCPDMGTKDYSGGTYKALVSGESITCRFIRETPFTSNLVPILMASVNEYPVTTDHSHGNYRRNVVIPFEQHFSEKDQNKELGFELREEVSIFFSWVFEGYKRIKESKGTFTHSDAIEQAGEKVKNESNTLLMFLYDSRYYPKAPKDNNEYTFRIYSSKELYSLYKSWYESEEYEIKFLIKKKKFNMIIENQGFEITENSRSGCKEIKVIYPTGNKLSDINQKTQSELLFGSEQEAIDNLPF